MTIKHTKIRSLTQIDKISEMSNGIFIFSIIKIVINEVRLNKYIEGREYV